MQKISEISVNGRSSSDVKVRCRPMDSRHRFSCLSAGCFYREVSFMGSRGKYSVYRSVVGNKHKSSGGSDEKVRCRKHIRSYSDISQGVWIK